MVIALLLSHAIQYYRHLHESGIKGWVQYQRLATEIRMEQRRVATRTSKAFDQSKKSKRAVENESSRVSLNGYCIYSSLPVRQRQYRVEKRQRLTYR